MTHLHFTTFRVIGPENFKIIFFLFYDYLPQFAFLKED